MSLLYIILQVTLSNFANHLWFHSFVEESLTLKYVPSSYLLAESLFTFGEENNQQLF